MNTAAAPTAALSERAARQAEVVQALSRALPAHALLWHTEDTTPYECDGLTAYRQRPLVVCLPETYDEVQAVLQVCHRLQVPVVARGAGTGLSGGAVEDFGVTAAAAELEAVLDHLGEPAALFAMSGAGPIALACAARRPDLVLLPDEPYPFDPDDGPDAFPAHRTVLAEGRLLTWYGPSLTTARERLQAIVRS